ncbi:hypothetical protein quinque_015855 [Culex quinquefasciatus]
MDTTLEPPFPTEIWEHIFRNCPLPDLKRFRLVCHRWNAIVTGCPALWRRFHVRFWPRTEALSPAVLPVVKQASFECNVEAVSSWWPRFAGMLEELAFDAGDVSITALFGMLKHYGIQYLISSPNLVNLSLVNCDLSGCRVPKGNLSVLQHLKLSSGQISPEMLAYMLSCHPQLETAGFFNMESVERGTLVKLLCASRKLRAIRLYKCPRADSAVEIMQDYFGALDLGEGSREVRFRIS